MIQGYAVDYTLVGSDNWVTLEKVCQSHTYVVKDLLEPGAQYVFRIRALNVHGYSKPSLETQIVQLEEDDFRDPLDLPKITKRRNTLVNENRRQNGKRKLEIEDEAVAGTSWGTLDSSDAKQRGKKSRSKKTT
uniref:Myomesin-2-like n=1 Tax=Diabrotica virgifera virgifera TaxID=50390 RepID=A0A6P7FMT1_DIAVI